MQVYDFINEFKSVPTSMILSFFGEDNSDGKIKYALSRLKNQAQIYQTDNNERTSLDRTHSLTEMDKKLIDALWVMTYSGSENIQMYSLLKQKEYPKTLIYAVNGDLYEISVLEPTEETLYKASILRDFDNFHSAHSINIALVYDRKSGERAISELKFDAYCMLEYPEDGSRPIPTFCNQIEVDEVK